MQVWPQVSDQNDHSELSSGVDQVLLFTIDLLAHKQIRKYYLSVSEFFILFKIIIIKGEN